MTPTFPHADVIDSRDLHDILAELESMAEDNDPETDYSLLFDLRELAEYLEDWDFGAVLISEHYFEDYARELAEDYYGQDLERGWPFNCIDWRLAAKELRYDYSAFEIEGRTYYAR